MWDAILKLFQDATINRMLILRVKLRNIGMNNDENVVSYLTRVRLVKDELAVIGDQFVNFPLLAKFDSSLSNPISNI